MHKRISYLLKEFFPVSRVRRLAVGKAPIFHIELAPVNPIEGIPNVPIFRHCHELFPKPSRRRFCEPREPDLIRPVGHRLGLVYCDPTGVAVVGRLPHDDVGPPPHGFASHFASYGMQAAAVWTGKEWWGGGRLSRFAGRRCFFGGWSTKDEAIKSRR